MVCVCVCVSVDSPSTRNKSDPVQGAVGVERRSIYDPNSLSAELSVYIGNPQSHFTIKAIF